MKRLLVVALSFFLIWLFCIPVFAHSGKTDAAGGHYDSSTGEYHYHHGYPAHQHTNGKCPYNFKDNTDHSSVGNSGSNKSDSSREGVVDIFALIAVAAVIGFIVWICWVSKSSSNKSFGSPKTSTASAIQTQANTKDSKVSELEAEIRRLQQKNIDLESSIRHKDALIKQKDIEINNYQKTDAQKRISELEISLKTAQRFRDSHWSQLTSLKKEHENYVKNAETELKKAQEAATPVSVAENNRLQNKVIELQIELQNLRKSIFSAPSEKQVEDLTSKIEALEKINKTHVNTINSLKKELASERKNTHATTAPAEEERRYYESKIEKLKGELKEPTYFKNLFTSSLRKLEKEGDTLFYNYPSVRDFYRQVTDKRFHRAMIEDISIVGKVSVQASIRSSTSTYTTSLQSCTCVDYQRTHEPCKHMLYLAYHTGVLLINKNETQKSIKIYLDKLQKTPVPKK